jgi:hypothetical protein
LINEKNEAGIRPETLQFVEDFKAKGYKVAEYNA